MLRGDLAAGLTVGTMLIPQGMAYALVAGLPPVYGLYAAITPQIFYALLGTSRQLAVGPVAMDSLLVAAGVSVIAEEGSANYLAYAILLALLVGVIQLLLGCLRMGFVTNLLARPVISGFTSAAAIIIGLNQMKHLLGYPISSDPNAFLLIQEVLSNISEIHIPSVLLGVGGLVVIKLSRHIIPKMPASLLVVVLGILLVTTFNLFEQGVKIVGSIPAGLPQLLIPELNWQVLNELLPLAVTIAVVGYIEAFSVAKAIESKKRDHAVSPNQELLALGAANFFGSLFQSFPVTGGFSRSAVNYQSGANTQLASLISAMLVAVTLLFFTGIFYYLPNAILAAIILVAVSGLIDWRYARQLWKDNRLEFGLLIATFFVTLNFSMVPGILAGISLSILLLLYRLGYPHIAVLGRVPGHREFRNVKRFAHLDRWEDVLILRLDGPLTFVNIQYFRDFVLRSLDAQVMKTKAVLLDAGPVSYLDATAAQGLRDLLAHLRSREIVFYLADVIGPVRDQLHRTNLIEEIGTHNVFLDLNDAIAFHEKHEKDAFHQAAVQTGELDQNQI